MTKREQKPEPHLVERHLRRARPHPVCTVRLTAHAASQKLQLAYNRRGVAALRTAPPVVCFNLMLGRGPAAAASLVGLRPPSAQCLATPPSALKAADTRPSTRSRSPDPSGAHRPLPTAWPLRTGSSRSPQLRLACVPTSRAARLPPRFPGAAAARQDRLRCYACSLVEPLASGGCCW